MTDRSLRVNTDLPNGPAAAALLAAGVGSAALGVLAVAADASVPLSHVLAFYSPTGALSGVTTLAILVWLGAWIGLARRWHGRQVALTRVNTGALILLLAGLLLTFPPFMDMLQGK